MIQFSPIFTNCCRPYIDHSYFTHRKLDKRLPAEHIVKCRKHPELTTCLTKIATNPLGRVQSE